MAKTTRNVKSKAEHVTMSFSVNKKLAQVINGITVSDEKSRSRVITELLEEALKARGMELNYEAN